MEETYLCISWSLPLRPDFSMIPDERVFSHFAPEHTCTPTTEDGLDFSNLFVASSYDKEEERNVVDCFISEEEECIASRVSEEEIDLIPAYYDEGEGEDFLSLLLTESTVSFS